MPFAFSRAIIRTLALSVRDESGVHILPCYSSTGKDEGGVPIRVGNAALLYN